ncbi:MAG: NAD(P)-dependent glycerol-3-phosphate dehydrogenase [Planctomycetota bacterium]|nr:NAD(P)-dependent glycerol-3-phosphate dehydrogenase [Planctomycetota bacterium]
MAEYVPEPVQRAVVIGGGSWGTALALLLARKGVEVNVWCNQRTQADEFNAARANTRYLPGVELPANLRFTADPHRAAAGAQIAVSAVPTQFLRRVAARFEDALAGNVTIVSATKGLEIETLSRPTEILEEVLGTRSLAVLSGPSHAEEVARGQPATVVAASKVPEVAVQAQAAFNGDFFRVYTSSDLLGVELAGALKNVIALAAGIGDGLALGDNAKAALVTRGMVEMARVGVSRGARMETFFGLAGIGDLVTTCCSRHSRNRAVGEAIGRGETLEQVLARMQMVAEGVWTTKALFGPESELSDVSMPIAAEVHAVLFESKPPRAAVADLMRREPAPEMKGLV